MVNLEVKIENFERITNWLGDRIDKYKDDIKADKNAIKFQKVFEKSGWVLLWKLVAKAHHMPKRFRTIFVGLNKKEKIALLAILQNAEIMCEEDCNPLLEFIEYYYESNHYLMAILRHYEAAIYAFKNFDFGDRGRADFIVSLYTDTEFYYNQVFGELGVEDDELIETLIKLKTKEKMISYLDEEKLMALNYPLLYLTVSNYALKECCVENYENFEKYGYMDTDDIRKEVKSEWN